MPRVRTRFPTVFVGHPFGHHFSTKKFRRLFSELPFNVVYGNTDIQTEHLLTIMKQNIKKADFALFDLSDWNPNVSLELGLAEGLRKKSLKPYYILLNTRRSKEVPADVRGIQRLEYTRYDYSQDAGLGDQLAQILRKEYWVKRIFKELAASGENESKRRKKLLLCLRIIAHLRNNEKLAPENLETLTRGTHFRQPDKKGILDLLRKLKFLRKLPNSSVYQRYRTVFRGSSPES